MGWNYLSIPKLQRCNRWSLGMDKYFHHTFYQACDYLSMLGLTLLNHVNTRGHGYQCFVWVAIDMSCMITLSTQKNLCNFYWQVSDTMATKTTFLFLRYKKCNITVDLNGILPGFNNIENTKTFPQSWYIGKNYIFLNISPGHHLDNGHAFK